jgi:hypothetical protein
MASYMAPSGQAYDAEILPGPGAFSLDVPASLLDLCVWAVEDADGDGNWDPNLDAMGQWGPDSIGPFGASGITVTLIDPPPAATTISGTVTFDGFTPSVSDTLWIAVAASSDPDVPPTASVPIGGPSNPQTYTVDRVGPGTYYIGALLLPGSGGGGQNPEGFAPPVVVNGVPVSGIDIVVPPVP